MTYLYLKEQCYLDNFYLNIGFNHCILNILINNVFSFNYCKQVTLTQDAVYYSFWIWILRFNALSSIFFRFEVELFIILFSDVSTHSFTVLSYGVLQVLSLFYSQPVEMSFICTEEFQFFTSKNVCMNFDDITKKSYQWICAKYNFFFFFFFTEISFSFRDTQLRIHYDRDVKTLSTM